MSGGAATVGRLVVSVSGDVDQLAIDMREAQAITDKATKDIVNGLQGITDATYARNDAGKRMLAALQEEIDTFGMGADELRVYKASLLGVGDQAAAMIGRINDMKAAQAAYTDQLAASEAQATQRIKEMVAASLSEVAAMNAAALATQNAANAQSQLNSVSRTWTDAQRLQMQNMAGYTASMRSAQEGTVALSAETQRILDRYDPLGTKLRSLESEFAVLRKEMGNSVDPAAMKAFQGLEDEIAKTKALMEKAGVEGFGKMEEGAKKSAFASAGATRELMVLGHEVISGNFSKIPGSFMVLAERMGGVSELLDPLAVGMVGVTVASLGVAGAMLKGHDQMVAMNNAMLVTSEYAGMSRQSMTALAESMTQTHEVTIGVANEIVLALTASGRVGGDAIRQIAHFISDFAKSTGQDIEQLTPKMIQLFTDPVKGAEELNNSMHFLTTTQLEHIAALERTGEIQAAQTELAKAATDHMPKQAQNIGIVTQALLDQRDAWTKLGQAIMQWGAKRDRPDQHAQDLRDQISEYLARGFTRKDDEVKAVQAQLDALEPTIQKQKELTQAQKDAAAANELQAKSWDAVKASSTAYHVEELQDRLKLIEAHKSENVQQEVEKRDAIRKTQDEIDAAMHSIGAADRQLYEQQMANQEAISEVKLKQTEDDINALYKLGKIDKDEFEQRMLMNSLVENEAKQSYERAMLRIAGLSEAERQAHQQKLKLLQAEHDAIESKGVNAQLADEQAQYDAYAKAVTSAGDAELKSLDAALSKQREHNAEIGKTREQIELAKQAAIGAATAELQVEDDAIRALLTQADLQGVLKGHDREIYELKLAYLDRIIAKQHELSAAAGWGAMLEADAKAADDAQKAWKHAADSIEQSLTDALMRGFESGKSFGRNLIDTLKNMFGTLVLRPIIQAVLAPVSATFASALTPSFAQAANPMSGSGGSSLIGAAQTAASLYRTVSGGFESIGSGIGQGVSYVGDSLGLNGMSTFGQGMQGFGMDGSLGSAAGYGQMASSAMGSAAGALGGHYIGNTIAGDYSINHGQAVTNIASIAGAIIGGPIGGVIGGAIGGLINRAFGHGSTQVQSDGMRGTLGDNGATVSGYQKLHQNGGWFTSDRNWEGKLDLAGGTNAAMSQAFAELKLTAQNAASALGVSSTAIDHYSKAFDIALTNDQAKNQQAITDFFTGLGDEMARKLVPSIEQFTKNGETASATLERLAGDFQATNQTAQLLGKSAQQVFGSIGLDSASARERLVDLAGGGAALTQQAAFYAQNFLTESQRLLPVQQALDAAMASLGLSGVKTREQFKAVVDSLDLTTAAGAKEFESLMQLADAFSQVHPATQAATKSMADIANEHADLQNQLDQLTMSHADLLTKQRDALDASNQSLFDQVQAAQAAKDAQDALKSSITGAIGNLQSFAASARSLSDSLLTGNLSPLTPEQQYEQLRKQYETTLASAQSGDATAQGNYSNVAQAFLTASQKINGGDSRYQADFARVSSNADSLATWAQGQVSTAQSQLDALNAQNVGLAAANATLTEIAHGIAQLPAALSGAPTTTAASPIDYSSIGTSNMVALVTEVKNLRAEVAALRADQDKQTGDIITGNARAADDAAVKVVDGVKEAAAENRWIGRVSG